MADKADATTTLDSIRRIVTHAIQAEVTEDDGTSSRSYSYPDETLEEIYQLLAEDTEEISEGQPALF